MGQEGSKEGEQFLPDGSNHGVGRSGTLPKTGDGLPPLPLTIPGRTTSLFGEEDPIHSSLGSGSVPGTPIQERRPKMMAGDPSNMARSSHRPVPSPMMSRSLTSMRSAPAGSPAMCKSSSMASREAAPPRSLSLSSKRDTQPPGYADTSHSSPESPSPTGEVKIVPSRRQGDFSPDSSVRYLSRSPRSGTTSLPATPLIRKQECSSKEENIAGSRSNHGQGKIEKGGRMSHAATSEALKSEQKPMFISNQGNAPTLRGPSGNEKVTCPPTGTNKGINLPESQRDKPPLVLKIDRGREGHEFVSGETYTPNLGASVHYNRQANMVNQGSDPRGIQIEPCIVNPDPSLAPKIAPSGSLHAESSTNMFLSQDREDSVRLEHELSQTSGLPTDVYHSRPAVIPRIPIKPLPSMSSGDHKEKSESLGPENGENLHGTENITLAPSQEPDQWDGRQSTNSNKILSVGIPSLIKQGALPSANMPQIIMPGKPTCDGFAKPDPVQSTTSLCRQARDGTFTSSEIIAPTSIESIDCEGTELQICAPHLEGGEDCLGKSHAQTSQAKAEVDTALRHSFQDDPLLHDLHRGILGDIDLNEPMSSESDKDVIYHPEDPTEIKGVPSHQDPMEIESGHEGREKSEMEVVDSKRDRQEGNGGIVLKLEEDQTSLITHDQHVADNISLEEKFNLTNTEKEPLVGRTGLGVGEIKSGENTGTDLPSAMSTLSVHDNECMIKDLISTGEKAHISERGPECNLVPIGVTSIHHKLVSKGQESHEVKDDSMDNCSQTNSGLQVMSKNTILASSPTDNLDSPPKQPSQSNDRALSYAPVKREIGPIHEAKTTTATTNCTGDLPSVSDPLPSVSDVAGMQTEFSQCQVNTTTSTNTTAPADEKKEDPSHKDQVVCGSDLTLSLADVERAEAVSNLDKPHSGEVYGVQSLENKIENNTGPGANNTEKDIQTGGPIIRYDMLEMGNVEGSEENQAEEGVMSPGSTSQKPNVPGDNISGDTDGQLAPKQPNSIGGGTSGDDSFEDAEDNLHLDAIVSVGKDNNSNEKMPGDNSGNEEKITRDDPPVSCEPGTVSGEGEDKQVSGEGNGEVDKIKEVLVGVASTVSDDQCIDHLADIGKISPQENPLECSGVELKISALALNVAINEEKTKGNSLINEESNTDSDKGQDNVKSQASTDTSKDDPTTLKNEEVKQDKNISKDLEMSEIQNNESPGSQKGEALPEDKAATKLGLALGEIPTDMADNAPCVNDGDVLETSEETLLSKADEMLMTCGNVMGGAENESNQKQDENENNQKQDGVSVDTKYSEEARGQKDDSEVEVESSEVKEISNNILPECKSQESEGEVNSLVPSEFPIGAIEPKEISNNILPECKSQESEGEVNSPAPSEFPIGAIEQKVGTIEQKVTTIEQKVATVSNSLPLESHAADPMDTSLQSQSSENDGGKPSSKDNHSIPVQGIAISTLPTTDPNSTSGGGPRQENLMDTDNFPPGSPDVDLLERPDSGNNAAISQSGSEVCDISFANESACTDTKRASENTQGNAATHLEDPVITSEGSTGVERVASSESKPELGDRQVEEKLCGKAEGNSNGTGEASVVLSPGQANSTSSSEVTNTATSSNIPEFRNSETSPGENDQGDETMREHSSHDLPPPGNHGGRPSVEERSDEVPKEEAVVKEMNTQDSISDDVDQSKNTVVTPVPVDSNIQGEIGSSIDSPGTSMDLNEGASADANLAEPDKCSDTTHEEMVVNKDASISEESKMDSNNEDGMQKSSIETTGVPVSDREVSTDQAGMARPQVHMAGPQDSEDDTGGNFNTQESIADETKGTDDNIISENQETSNPVGNDRELPPPMLEMPLVGSQGEESTVDESSSERESEKQENVTPTTISESVINSKENDSPGSTPYSDDVKVDKVDIEKDNCLDKSSLHVENTESLIVCQISLEEPVNETSADTKLEEPVNDNGEPESAAKLDSQLAKCSSIEKLDEPPSTEVGTIEPVIRKDEKVASVPLNAAGENTNDTGLILPTRIETEEALANLGEVNVDSKDSDDDEFEDCVTALPASEKSAASLPSPEAAETVQDNLSLLTEDKTDSLTDDIETKEKLVDAPTENTDVVGKSDPEFEDPRTDISPSENIKTELPADGQLEKSGPVDEPESQSSPRPTSPVERPIKPASFDFNNLDVLIGPELKEEASTDHQEPSDQPAEENNSQPALPLETAEDQIVQEDSQDKAEISPAVVAERDPTNAGSPTERPIKPAAFDFDKLEEHFAVEDIGSKPEENKATSPVSVEKPIKPAKFDFSSVGVEETGLNDAHLNEGATAISDGLNEKPVHDSAKSYDEEREGDVSLQPKSPSAERPLKPATFDYSQVDDSIDPFGCGNRRSSSPPIRPAKFDYSEIDESIDPFGSGNCSASVKEDVKKTKVSKPQKKVKAKPKKAPSKAKESKVEVTEEPVDSESKTDPIAVPPSKSSETMDDNAPAPKSPPVLARGAYNFDFESFDENTNPFATKAKMSSSPPRSSVKPSSLDINGGELDPFKPRKAMANSPPGSPRSKLADAIDNNLPLDSSNTTGAEDNKIEADPKKIVKKKPPQSKTTPPRRSKFKPPTNFGKCNDTDDVQIFVPGEPQGAGLDNPAAVTDSPHTDASPHTSDHLDQLQDQESFQLQSRPPTSDTLQTPDSLGGDSASQCSSQYDNGVDSSQSDLHSYEANGDDFRPQANVGAQWDMINKYDNTSGEIKDSDRQSLYVKAEEPSRGAVSPALPKALARLKPQIGAQHDSSGDELQLTAPAGKTKHPNARALGEPVEGPTGDEKHDVPKDVYAYSPANPEHENLPSLHSSVGCSSEMSTSREQTIPPDMSSSWLESVNSYNELEGDSAILSDSLDCGGGLVGWAQAQAENGRPESPLHFDHEEVLRIDTDQQSEASGASPMRSNGEAGSMDPVDIMQVVKYSQTDMNRMRKELELELQAKLLIKERDWQKQTEEISKERDALKQANTEMGTIVVEYERSIAQTIEEKEDSLTTTKDNLKEVCGERDQALEDLQSVESAFSDLHRRFEKTKATVENFKRNEITLKKCVADLQAKLKKQEQKNQLIKEKAEDKIESLGAEMDKMRREHQTEAMRLQAATRKLELQTTSLDTALEQKTRENKELTAICDELISKVGSQ